MKSTGWKVIDYDENTRIAEFKTENPDDKLVSYEEAKADALKRLRDHVAPYLARIEELEQDEFAEAGALPLLKAWRRYHEPRAVVTAKTKKRAMELAQQTRNSFDSSWHECKGDWWYHLAQEEAVWVEERDDEKKGTGVYCKPVSREEAEQILELFISPYRTMNIDELLAQVGQTSTTTGVSSQGTPCMITAEVDRGEYEADLIFVRVRLDDFLGWQCPAFSWYERNMSELASFKTEEWAKEGF